MPPPQAPTRLATRVGAASIGLFAGVALGFLVGILSLRIAPCVFGGAAAGAITGLTFPEVAMGCAEFTLYFFAGVMRGAGARAFDGVEEADFPDRAPTRRWLKAAFIFGGVFAVILAVLLRS